MTEQDEVIEELFALAHRRGIKPQNAREAIEKSTDPKALLRRWRRAHEAEGRRLIAAQERREAEEVAEESRERHGTRQEAELRRRQFARSCMRLGQRLDVALAEAACVSGIPSNMGSFGMKIKGINNGGPALRPEPLEDLEKHLFVIEARIKMVEQDLDHARGLGPSAQTVMMTTAEKDAMILRHTGRTPEEINEAYPWLGSPFTIAKVRKMHGLHSKDGTVNPKSIYAKTDEVVA